ncbi:uncharacterized protein FSUBG_56 [Fusarium subglutinans]|uniref:Uncharacterized protein n=1 Tax=Gibberella subglutinans TaxID=42677 RepID=A0A8H5V891_GIBSU|nr:uncharacterized protein FSUBG_56 [Fusarium subglutinans]KAF5614176.1 hypothetical protein FSUBG_56 [Fusarium subglutinans]
MRPPNRVFTRIIRISKFQYPGLSPPGLGKLWRALGMLLEPDCPSVAPPFPAMYLLHVLLPNRLHPSPRRVLSLGYMLLKSTSTSHERQVEIFYKHIDGFGAKEIEQESTVMCALPTEEKEMRSEESVFKLHKAQNSLHSKFTSSAKEAQTPESRSSGKACEM